MILKGAEATRYLARPDPARAGLLIHGADPMRVAMKRQQAVAALLGPGGEAEMRLTRIAGADLRRDPAALQDATRAAGFFPGPRVVLVEDAGEALAPILAEALEGWAPGDAQIVVTAAALAAKSALRAAFEGHRAAVAIALWDDPPTREEIAAELARAGLAALPPAAGEALAGLARALEPGDFRQLLERIALYKFGDPAPLDPAEIAALAPASIEAEADALVDAAAAGRPAEIPPLMARLSAQGVAPVTICIAAARHLRALHALACDPAGPQAAIGRLRPPPPWKRREVLLEQVRGWRRERLEAGLALMLETDLALRSSSRAPGAAVIERALIRLAHLRRG